MVCSQNKTLSEYQRRVSPSQAADRPFPPQEAERQRRGNVGTRDGILHQFVSSLPVTNEVFPGSWMDDIYQDGHSQRSAPQRHTAHLRWCSHGTPRNPRGWDQGGDKMHHPAGRVHSPSTWWTELFGPHKGTKRRPIGVCVCVEYPNVNKSGLELGNACNPGHTLDSSPAEQPGARAV